MAIIKYGILTIIGTVIGSIVLMGSESNFTYAQGQIQLHQKTLYYLYEKPISSKQIAHIHVGRNPSAIDLDPFTNTIYVVNRDDYTISVINGTSNTKIGKDIPVGRVPSAIAVSYAPIAHLTGFIQRLGIHTRIYVSNSWDNTVSVIDGTSHTVIGKPIPVGNFPGGIGINRFTNTIYVANGGDNTVSVINGTSDTKIGKDIPVGKTPSAIDVDPVTMRAIYVANWGDNTVSVINGTIYMKWADVSNTKIGKDIPVGNNPAGIGVNRYTNRIYVANYRDNTVSVIDGRSHPVIGKPIHVGKGPTGIGINRFTNTIYVANGGDDTVSVINGTSDTVLRKPIHVGSHPKAIGVDVPTNTIYVANGDDNTVSVIDGKTDKVVAGVMFSTKPSNAGRIECDNLIAPIANQFYIWSGSVCVAKPSQGFQFDSWQENLVGNSTQYVSIVGPQSFWNSTLDSILDFLHINHDRPEARLNITKFGSFTANFKALPPPIPPEYVATLFTVVATAFIGSWLTPAIIGWRKSKRQRKYFKECENQIGKLDKNTIEEKIIGYYVDGKISQEHRQYLNDKISEYYRQGSERRGAGLG